MMRSFKALLVIMQITLAASAASAFAQAPLPQTEAQVRKVDKSAGRITLQHDEIKNLEMPGMTMVFQVKDPALLEKVKAGDKVTFTVDKVNGAYTVLSIERRN